MPNPWLRLFDIKRVIRAGGYSLKGLKAALASEAAFRQEAALFVVLAPLGYWLGRSPIERALLVGVLVLVLIIELLNSAIETLVNRVGAEPNELSGRVKDIASAAVFLALLLVPFVWAVILLPRIL